MVSWMNEWMIHGFLNIVSFQHLRNTVTFFFLFFFKKTSIYASLLQVCKLLLFHWIMLSKNSFLVFSVRKIIDNISPNFLFRNGLLLTAECLSDFEAITNFNILLTAQRGSKKNPLHKLLQFSANMITSSVKALACSYTIILFIKIPSW